MIKFDVEPDPNQEFMMLLDGQSCTVNIYERDNRLYMDLYMDGEAVQLGSMLQPRAPTVTRTDRKFRGNIRVVDMSSEPDKQAMPFYQGLGSRFEIYYLTSEEEKQVARYDLY